MTTIMMSHKALYTAHVADFMIGTHAPAARSIYASEPFSASNRFVVEGVESFAIGSFVIDDTRGTSGLLDSTGTRLEASAVTELAQSQADTIIVSLEDDLDAAITGDSGLSVSETAARLAGFADALETASRGGRDAPTIGAFAGLSASDISALRTPTKSLIGKFKRNRALKKLKKKRKGIAKLKKKIRAGGGVAIK